MTKKYSCIDDNGGRCERCNKPGSEYLSQRTVKVRLGGGMGWGTMWVCSSCLDAEEKRETRHLSEEVMIDVMQGNWIKFERVCRNKWGQVIQEGTTVYIGKKTVLAVKDYTGLNHENTMPDPESPVLKTIPIDLGPTCIVVLSHVEYEVKCPAESVAGWAFCNT